jgi:hypothetical protein
MKMGVCTYKEIFTSGWDNVVKKYMIEEDDIILFSFYPMSDGGLALLLAKLCEVVCLCYLMLIYAILTM